MKNFKETWSRRRWLGLTGAGVGAVLLNGRVGSVRAAEDEDKAADPDELTRKGVAFLRERQETGGGWSTQREPGITAIAVTALLRTRRVLPAEPVVTKALAYLEGQIGPKGGVAEAGRANYGTSIALMAFREANTDKRYDALIQRGQQFLKGLVWDDTYNIDRENPFYGGAGYRPGNSRPDLSNTSFLIETLRETGLPADDPDLKKALIFVSRCQNLKSEFNDQPWADKVNDGGFIYATARGGESIAGKDEATGGLRSYASMTYAGLKSMIYAGLSADDPRVKAAKTYLTKHYSLDENPGLGQQGLYYYYQTFAKTLALLGEPMFRDAEGRSHDWRADLTAALAKRQGAEGGWVNPNDRFMEGDPNLVTGYALLALAYARPKS